MRTSFKELTASNKILLADGATGTAYFEMGLVSGDAPEFWNIGPDAAKVKEVHKRYTDAGSDIILTNSFGGTRHRLKLHNAQDRVFELNKAAAEVAGEVARDADHPVLVAGSVGPTGELLFPLGELTFDDAVEAFHEQIEGLKAGGADLIWIETMSAADEIEAAAKAAIALDMPYVITASFDTAGRTMMGLEPGKLPETVSQYEKEPLAIGANCGVGASDLVAAILEMTKEECSPLVVAKANCGIPVISGDKVLYSGTPELMAEYAKLAANSGARIIGGCCGNTEAHIKAMKDALKGYQPGKRPTLDEIQDTIGPFTAKVAAEPNEAAPRERRSRRKPKS